MKIRSGFLAHWHVANALVAVRLWAALPFVAVHFLAWAFFVFLFRRTSDAGLRSDAPRG